MNSGNIQKNREVKGMKNHDLKNKKTEKKTIVKKEVKGSMKELRENIEKISIDQENKENQVKF